MTADELVSLVAALPGVRRLPAEPPLKVAVLVAGIEVASTALVTDPVRRVLGASWNAAVEVHARSCLLAEDPGRPHSLAVALA